MNEDQSYRIGAFAKLTGVTERTLRYYDRVNLLKPSQHTTQGHRVYTDKDLLTLQKILTLKFLDFSLNDISLVIHNPEQNLQQALATQEVMLQRKKEHLERVTGAIHRVKLWVDKEEEVDSDMLLGLIHMVQYEEEQQQWLTSNISESFSDLVFMKGKSAKERSETEQQITSSMLILKKYCKAGHAPDSDAVQDTVGKLVDIILEIIEPNSIEEMSKQLMEVSEGEQGESIDWKEPDPILFPDIFNDEEEAFLAKAIEILNNRKEMLITLSEMPRTEQHVESQEVSE